MPTLQTSGSLKFTQTTRCELRSSSSSCVKFDVRWFRRAVIETSRLKGPHQELLVQGIPAKTGRGRGCKEVVVRGSVEVGFKRESILLLI